MTRDQGVWQEARLHTKKITDKLGTPVDKEIIDTVTVLRLLGFHTTGSCGGHIRRTTSGPYVIVLSPEARHYATMARELNDRDRDRYAILRRKANRFRAFDLQRLSAYLEEFYQEQPLCYNAHLIVQSMPMTLNILKCHGAELTLVTDIKARKEILEKNRAEISAFTKYLRARYLGS